MNRTNLLYLLFIPLLLSLAVDTSVLAQGEEEYWCYVFNFIDNNGGWTVVNGEGEWVQHDGFQANDAGTGNNTRQLTIQYNLPSEAYLRHMFLVYYSTTHNEQTLNQDGEYLRVRVNHPANTFTAINQSEFRHRPNGTIKSSVNMQRDVSTIEISTLASTDTAAAPSEFKLTQVYFQGRGPQPFTGGAIALTENCNYPSQYAAGGNNSMVYLESAGLYQQTAVLGWHGSVFGGARATPYQYGIVSEIRPATLADCADFLGPAAVVGNACGYTADGSPGAFYMDNIDYVAIDMPDYGLRNEYLVSRAGGFMNVGREVGNPVGRRGCTMGRLIPDTTQSEGIVIHQMRALENGMRLAFLGVNQSGTVYNGDCGFNVPQSDVLDGDLWCREFDFSTGDRQGWAAWRGEASWDLAGWADFDFYGASSERWARIVYPHHIPQLEEVVVEFDWLAGNRPNYVQFIADAATGTPNTFHSRTSSNWTHPPLYPNGINQDHWVFDPQSGPVEVTNNISISFSPSGAGGDPGEVFITKVTIKGRGGNPFPAGHGRYISGEGCNVPLPDLVKPFAASNYSWGLMRNIYSPGDPTTTAVRIEDTVVHWSEMVMEPVHAPISGTVVSIDRVNSMLCRNYLDRVTVPPGVIYEPRCSIHVGDEVDGIPGDNSDTHFNFYRVPENFGAYYAYRVIIENSGLYYTTWLYEAPQYVEIDTVVTAGCIIGNSMPLEVIEGSGAVTIGIGASGPTAGLSLPLHANPNNTFQYGAVVSHITDAHPDQGPSNAWSISPFDNFTLDPPADAQPCSAPAEFLQCINVDPRIKNPAAWTATGSVVISGSGGATVNADSSLYQMLNINETQEPEIVVKARGRVGGTAIQLYLGSGKVHFNLTSSFYEYKTPYSATNLSLWRSGLTTSTGIAEVDYICVRNTKDDEGEDIPPPTDGPGGGEEPPPQPVDIETGCSFLNAAFDDGSNHWTTGEGVGAYGGLLNVPDDGTFSQSITISEPGLYYLRARAALTTSFLYNIAGDSPGNITLQYDLTGSGTWVTVEQEAVAAWANGNQRELQTSINFTEPYDGPIYFRVLFNENVDAGVQALAIDYICLNGSPALVDATCTTVTEPTSPDVGAWIGWLWANMNNFYNCQLMIAINDIYAAMLDMYNLAGWSVRWFQVTLRTGVDWFQDQFIPWLGGYLANISPGTVYAEQQCNNLFCLLSGLFDVGGSLIGGIIDLIAQTIEDILSPIIDFVLYVLRAAFDLLLSVLELLLSLVMLLITRILEVFGIAQAWIMGIITAYLNAAPQPLPGMPDCSAYEEHFLCSAVYVAEFTFFSGPLGALIIPLTVSLGYILVAVIFAKRLFRAIIETGRSL